MDTRKVSVALALTMLLSLTVASAFAIERAPRISDREIIERLTRLEGGQAQLRAEMIQRFEAVNQRFEAVNQRFEGINQRFEGINQRFEAVNERITDLRETMLWGFGLTFAGLFFPIGFVVWDRRTALSPAIRQQELLTRVLQDYAAQHPDLAEILKSRGLL
jgi:hypothetical protein